MISGTVGGKTGKTSVIPEFNKIECGASQWWCPSRGRRGCRRARSRRPTSVSRGAFGKRSATACPRAATHPRVLPPPSARRASGQFAAEECSPCPRAGGGKHWVRQRRKVFGTRKFGRPQQRANAKDGVGCTVAYQLVYPRMGCCSTFVSSAASFAGKKKCSSSATIIATFTFAK